MPEKPKFEDAAPAPVAKIYEKTAVIDLEAER